MRIYNDNIGVEFGMCHANNDEQKTTNDGKNRTTKSRKIRTLGKLETCKYLGILEAETIKQAEMKEKSNKKNPPGEQENYSKPNYIADNFIKWKNIWAVSLKRYSRESEREDEEKNFNKCTGEQENSRRGNRPYIR